MKRLAAAVVSLIGGVLGSVFLALLMLTIGVQLLKLVPIKAPPDGVPYPEISHLQAGIWHYGWLASLAIGFAGGSYFTFKILQRKFFIHH